MKYRVYLCVKMQSDKWVTIGGNHSILWDLRSLIEASSGWTVLNQEDIGPADSFIPRLEKGILELTQHTEAYRNYEVFYGIGTIDNAVAFYTGLLKDCKTHPFTELYGCIVA
ncbi:hypothetical protein [Clostridium sp. KNHs216]|uniref:hypothetical protein n=1 Tax=Eubacteriales TaxID=186802 RepID=UPI00114D8C48|nr:hypothetical protein [Clostridium sp. KNHs216]TQI66836.1 hypothetical protein LY85_1518 [Clostridium sp. KNHs216]